MSDEYDVIVLGAGVAGLTAARHAAEGGHRVLLIEQMGAGGQVSTVEGITNFPGRTEPIAGYDLGVELLEEAEAAGAEVVLAHADQLAPAAAGFVISAGTDEFRGRAIIVAVGSERRTLGVAGEAEFDGRGVSHCASCDGPFFRDKAVIVVGGGDSAFDEARILAEQAARVVIVHRGDAPTARGEIIERATAFENLEVRADATVERIGGDGAVGRVTVRDLRNGLAEDVAVQGVFVYVGLVPNTEWLGDLVTLDEGGRIVVDSQLATSRPGVFAAGDVRSDTTAMLHESAEDGARAAQAAVAYLERSA